MWIKNASMKCSIIFYQPYQFMNQSKSCVLYVPKAFLYIGADSLVVRTSCCGRSYLGLHPWKGKFLFSVAVYLYDLIDSFMTLLFARFRHIWYQNDGNEMLYDAIRFIFKNSNSWIFSEIFSSFLDTFSVTVTLTFDPRSQISIGSEPVQ